MCATETHIVASRLRIASSNRTTRSAYVFAIQMIQPTSKRPGALETLRVVIVAHSPLAVPKLAFADQPLGSSAIVLRSKARLQERCLAVRHGRWEPAIARRMPMD